ncbi:Redox-sensitive bicupin YhaK, pirin superfamily [Pseudomonas chlororaphis]|uniref:pirin family protein n=1 Tax=Pseudomonas chlororaphis TaxID=587753 RepID=UPI00087BB74A|nr:pirin family protein [Pseudomonas chlororaphis]AZD66987.1 Pirin [Pseudomonas chlororaphis subsp. aurantiaca]QIT23003.1 pirin family protein [Pseudomonas chlororaphis subsp. aurantiaca]WDH01088.1 pirin family protein [Pseudomonas chlororaphis]WDH10066.1 pirin family protein [Pseudomonas chlororaphis]SDT17932.1 Redox-sensitive bicupin YhaK, pirin superfamily [Pseudomonas chlororaphis]
MTTSTTERENTQLHLGHNQRPRDIVHRTRGTSSGPITRLVSPSDWGGLIKPFVFLDLFDFEGGHAPSLELGWHPHSGIATVTVLLDGSVQYAETTGSVGVLPTGGVEWMQAGGGVWHTGTVDSAPARGFQLWVALPPDLENAPSMSHYVMPEDVPHVGPVRVILGSYNGLSSPIVAPPMTYLQVTLKDGERWTFLPPSGHDVAWLSLMDGALHASSRITGGEVAIFERGETAIELVAEGDTQFVLGSAKQHPHELVLGHYSVHTSVEALRRGEAEIRRIGHQLRAEGKYSYALRSI